MIRPTFRFGYVEDNLSRGGFLKEENRNFIKLLNLKTILNLSFTKEFVNFDLKTINFNLEKQNQENIKLSFQKMTQIILTIIDSKNHPMYINCVDGFITNLVVACLRKLQGYQTSIILEEATRFSKEQVLSHEEKDYIANWSGEMDISQAQVQRLPKW
jgi:tyrosine-protein phosphatase OCA6